MNEELTTEEIDMLIEAVEDEIDHINRFASKTIDDMMNDPNAPPLLHELKRLVQQAIPMEKFKAMASEQLEEVKEIKRSKRRKLEDVRTKLYLMRNLLIQ